MSKNAPRKEKSNKSNSQPVNSDDSSAENSDNSNSVLVEPKTAPCYSCNRLLPKSSEGVLLQYL